MESLEEFPNLRQEVTYAGLSLRGVNILLGDWACGAREIVAAVQRRQLHARPIGLTLSDVCLGGGTVLQHGAGAAVEVRIFRRVAGAFTGEAGDSIRARLFCVGHRSYKSSECEAAAECCGEQFCGLDLRRGLGGDPF